MSKVYVLEMKPKYRYISTVIQTFHINCVNLDFGHYGRDLQAALDSHFFRGDSPDFYVKGDRWFSLFGNRIPLPNAVTPEDAFLD